MTTTFKVTNISKSISISEPVLTAYTVTKAL